MTEYDLFDAIGEIDSSFVKNAAKPPFPLTDVSLAKGRLIHNKKITFAMIAATLALVLCGGLVTYKLIQKKNTVSEEAVGSTVCLTVPEGITKIIIEDKASGASGILTSAVDISEFYEKMNAITGTVQKNSGTEECRYVVRCYKDNEEVISYAFISKSLICESVGSKEKAIEISVGEEEILPYDIVEYKFIQSQRKAEGMGDPVLAVAEVGNTYMILEGLTSSSEIMRTQEDIHGRPGYIDYVKVGCTVRYTNHPDNGGVVNGISDIYIPAASVQEFISHDMVMIRVIQKSINDQYCFFAVCDEDANVEYLPIEEGMLRIPDGFNLENSMAFGPLWILNDYLDQVETSLARGREPSEKEERLPKKKISDGMSLQDIIDYFEAYNTWADWSDAVGGCLID